MKLTDIAHFVGGVLAALAGFTAPVVSVLMVAMFIIYELDEDWHINDKAYRDIRVFMLGFYLAVAGVILAHAV